MNNVKRFEGRRALMKARGYIAVRRMKGEHWEIAENQTRRTVIMRRTRME